MEINDERLTQCLPVLLKVWCRNHVRMWIQVWGRHLNLHFQVAPRWEDVAAPRNHKVLIVYGTCLVLNKYLLNESSSVLTSRILEPPITASSLVSGLDSEEFLLSGKISLLRYCVLHTSTAIPKFYPHRGWIQGAFSCSHHHCAHPGLATSPSIIWHNYLSLPHRDAPLELEVSTTGRAKGETEGPLCQTRFPQSQSPFPPQQQWLARALN